MRQNNQQSQSGNVFIIILAGVFLFGALMFTFSRSGQQGTGNLTKQQAKIAAQELISFFNLVDNAYNKLRMKGCSESDISFANSGDTGPFIAINDSATAPVDKSCHIFDMNGGKVSFNMDWTKYQIPYSQVPVPDQTQHGNLYFNNTGGSNVGVGTTANDIMVHFNFVAPEICFTYNTIIDNSIDTSIEDAGPISGDENTTYANKENYCRYHNANGRGQIRKVWLAK